MALHERYRAVSGSRNALLITGAGGYLGSRLARHHLERGRQPLTLWLHAGSKTELEQKAAALRSQLGPEGGAADIRGGDLCTHDPFAEIDAGEIGSIVHCAAVTRFNVEEKIARKVNVDGTRKLLEFASGCPDLERLIVTS